MKRFLFIPLVTLIALFLFIGVRSDNGVYANSTQDTFPLYAGQDTDVGEVTVDNDGDWIYFSFELDSPWCMTEAHIHIGESKDDFPLAGRTKNPVPGKFAYIPEIEGCVTEFDYEVENKWESGQKLMIAVHTVVNRMECSIETEAPYSGVSIYDYDQGLRKDNSPVREGRSDPEAVLTWDTNRVETDFFSLGFEGEIIVEFDCPIINGDGYDVMVVEDTWGTYPLESADVYASTDGEDWILLGEADNTTRDLTYDWQTVSEFDLGDLEYARYIKIVDTTPIGTMPNDGDGFDLNTIVALHDCEVCEFVESETAWAEGTRFTMQGNWGTYFGYTVKSLYSFLETVTVPSNLINGATTSNILESNTIYRFIARGTWQNSNLNTLDAECRLNTGSTEWEESAPRSLRLQVNDAYFIWGDKCAPDNVYEAYFQGLGNTVKFRIADGNPPVPGWYGDNVGNLYVDIYEIL